jgi:hypothetical protein
MSKISNLREEYHEYKTDFKRVKFGGNCAKCDLCNKFKKTCYDLNLYVKGIIDCDCKGIGCNNCRTEDELNFAIVCSKECEMMLIMKVMG